MAQFFKFVFASMLGTFLTLVIASILLFAIIVGIVGSANSEKPVKISENSILSINLDYPVYERTPADPFSDYHYDGFQSNNGLGLNDILESIKKAKTDAKIKGIYLNLTGVQTGFANTEEIRNALIDFKKSGKFVIAYSEVYSQKAYYLATVANKIYLYPQGALEFKGFASENMFFKGALEKLEIEPQVIRVGTYKSFVEPFVLDKMSEANRMQVTDFLGSLYSHFLTKIGEAREIPKDSLFNIANRLQIQQPEDALNYKMVDALKYEDEVLADLRTKTNTAIDEDLSFIPIKKYKNVASSLSTESSSTNRIAMVYASGDINSGEGDDHNIGSERLSKAIREAREDKHIKAIVLRVNSPGGSALASDVIWREVMLAKKAKPVVVSMGDVAASGGYYISCAADKIFAQPNTITGSIGVFGIIPNAQKFFNNKLGITFDVVKTGEYADMGGISHPLSESEKLIIQNGVNRTYDIFISRVAAGRKKTKVEVDSIGQGRVWTGREALKNGLVDNLGGVNDAVKEAAALAKIKDYKIVNYPSQKSILDSFLGGLSGTIKSYFVEKELGDNYKIYEKLKKITTLSGIQARMPYELSIQ
ncbi:signal peptide peptidase SppA [Solitalea koreensis]|uniref:Protease-4 n=1 Tax=Solitalea koreensis TaxID=543615 RepID=A0A521D904_9SPHI|nr:signal peptide peptidase SppA [Solitalea koreensis]SMO68196.1 protease-4 [Solitalea koreensis]